MEAFELRLWDGRLGRWLTTDPFRQHSSPYLGMGNNPVSRIDPNGGEDWHYDADNNLVADPGDNASTLASFLCMPLSQAQSMFNANGFRFESTLSGGEFFNTYGSINLDAVSIMGGSRNHSISDNGLAFLAQREGTILKPYNDSKGFATIGIGHLIGKRNVTAQDRKDWAWLDTKAEAQDLFRTDLSTKYEPAVNRMVKVKLAQHQYDAIVSFTYNVGIHGLQKSNFLRELNNGNYNGNLMLNYRRPAEIIGRRTREVNLFNDGQY